jgi:hypothetical protein
MQLWDELVAVVEQITLNDEFDVLVWSYEKIGGLLVAIFLYHHKLQRCETDIYSCNLGGCRSHQKFSCFFSFFLITS